MDVNLGAKDDEWVILWFSQHGFNYPLFCIYREILQLEAFLQLQNLCKHH